MNYVQLFQHLDWAWVAAILSGQVIPWITAKVTASPKNAVTGLVTLVLSTAAGFFSEWAKAGDNFEAKAAIGVSFAVLISALTHQAVVLRGTDEASKLHASGPQIGSKKHRRVAGEGGYVAHSLLYVVVWVVFILILFAIVKSIWVFLLLLLLFAVFLG